MKLVELNMCEVGSTGRIMLSIANEVRNEGGFAVTFSAPMFSLHKTVRKKIDGHIYFANQLESNIHYLLGRFTARNGCYSYFATKRLVKKIENIHPDVIHLHNLHGFNINLPVLFNYLKKSDIPVVWTLHDCWSFTGHCSHFLISGCNKWKTHCKNCNQYKSYPKVEFDNSKYMYDKKREWFTGINNLTVVTPSIWLSELVKESFLAEYRTVVINNGVDLEIFKPTPNEIRKQYGLSDQYIILGVSFAWGYSKGLDVFVELAKILPKNYKIFLIGTDTDIDKTLPSNIISVHRTNNQRELAEYYSAADVFVNPTREDTFPTVNIEALACGTPVVTFNTGGSPEIIDESCGMVIQNDNLDLLASNLQRICVEKKFGEENCIKRARSFEYKSKIRSYLELFESIKNKSEEYHDNPEND